MKYIYIEQFKMRFYDLSNRYQLILQF